MPTAPMTIDPEVAALEGWAESDGSRPEGFDADELVDALRREAESAESEYDRVKVIIDQARDYYEAKPFGNEVDGRSQIVLPDVQEAIDYMVPSVLRTFVSGDRVVEFEATDEADEKAADEATAAIGYSFMRQQDGYRVLLDWLKCGLLEKIGVAKSMMTTDERVTRDRVTITDPVELETLEGEIEDAEEQPDGSYVVSIKREVRTKRFVDEAVPLEEFRFSARARHEDESDYLAHVPIKTRSDLVDMGFDRTQAYAVPSYSVLPNRYDDRDHQAYDPDPESTPALQLVELREEYARIDLDGDGIAERVRVFRVENEILLWADKNNPHPIWGSLAIETVEEQPFSVFCPFPRPHRLVGDSLAEKVMDIQLGRSTIARQLFDGMYQGNMPRPIVETGRMDENTIDDLLSPIAGAPIRVASAGGVVPYQTNFDVGKSLTVMEWFAGERESRTGITRLNQGLNADTLNTNTATAFRGLAEQGQQQEEFIARNFAESFGRLIMKKYRLMKREGEPFKVKVDGQYKTVDPSQWPDEVNLSVRVGLGTGSKDKRIQARLQLAPFMAEGFENKVVTAKHLFHAVDGLVRDLGLGQGDDFWVDPDAPPEIDPMTGQPKQPEPEAPDPEAMAAQAEAQREQAKMQMQQQAAEAQMQLDQQKAAATLQLERDKASANIDALRERHALEMEQKREAAQLEAQLARDKADAEAQIAIYRIDKEAEVKAYAARVSGVAGETDIGQNRGGGALDA